MTVSDTEEDLRRLVRVAILGFPVRSSAAHSRFSPEHTFNALHMIVTYTALITLAILRDDFTRLDPRSRNVPEIEPERGWEVRYYFCRSLLG